MTAAERETLTAEAHALEARLDKFRAWYRGLAAEEARLLDALKAHRARMGAGQAKAYALSARLSGIRARLADAKAGGSEA